MCYVSFFKAFPSSQDSYVIIRRNISDVRDFLHERRVCPSFSVVSRLPDVKSFGSESTLKERLSEHVERCVLSELGRWREAAALLQEVSH